MNDNELLRYSRHILLEAVGIEGQQRISHAHVLLVGAGGLGCAAGLYLAAAGVRRLTIVDDDFVDLTNLQRQVAHTTDRIGQSKVSSAAASFAAINPLVDLRPVQRRADPEWLNETMPTVDVVLDCSDNFQTRHAVNADCVRHGRALVSGAALRFDGQLALYDSTEPDGACYACVFPQRDAVEEVSCATSGVFSPLVGMVGTAQAALALQVILGLPGRKGELARWLRMVDGMTMEWTQLRLARNPSCAVCGAGAPRSHA